jgi:uncharacterized protein (TIGR02996 family)
MPTDEKRALWSAIRANPNDDTPRLVYADWLQEHGDEARAEFIRVQCALEQLGPDRRKGRKQRPALEKRQKALLTKHEKAWLAPFRARFKGTQRWGSDAWLERLTFRRGLIDTTQFDLECGRVLAAAGDELEPVDGVSVMEMGIKYNHASVVTIADWPGAGCVVCFSIAWATDEDVTAIIRPGHMRNLFYLGLWGGKVTDDGAAQLAAWPFAASLRALDIKDNPITDAGALALADSPHLSNLSRLDLYGTRIGKKGRTALRKRFKSALAINAYP